MDDEELNEQYRQETDPKQRRRIADEAIRRSEERDSQTQEDLDKGKES